MGALEDVLVRAIRLGEAVYVERGCLFLDVEEVALTPEEQDLIAELHERARALGALE